MTRYRLKTAFLPQGWTRDARVSVSAQGFITAIDTGPPGARSARSAPAGTAAPAASAAPIEPAAPEEIIDGVVVPGMPNAHSHAFQRAMAGNAEYRHSARDSFWTWREAMYALANRIEPAELQNVATQLFVEMLKAGYTSVAEFHYLHRRSDGTLYAGANELWDAISDAAATAGIGLTFLPTLYQTSDFGDQPLSVRQARFGLDTDTYLRTLAERIRADHLRAGRAGGFSIQRTGAAFHSLRAVPLGTLRETANALRGIDAAMPVHIHVAEQLLEVKACVAATGMRPVQLLLEQGLLTPHWCLVHATHATAGELKGISATSATVCVSVSTEANLGDGFFDTGRFLKSGGRLCIGSDSQSTVNPAEELRWLEYQQRLRKNRRGALATREQPHVGTRLWGDAARSGAQAIGQPVGSIEVGRRADWLVLDGAHPSMAGAPPAAALDHLLFAGGDAAIRDVMVAGRWVIRNHRHDAEPQLTADFARLMQRLAGTIPVT